MLVVVIGLATALVYGASDFLGGVAAKRIGPLLVTGASALVSTILVSAAAMLLGGVWSAGALRFGVYAGIAAAIALGLLYACLAIGPMSILSPIAAVVGAVVPVVIGLAQGDALGTLGFVALGLGLVAVVLVGIVPQAEAVRPSVRGVLMAIGAGIGLGASLVFLDAAPEDSGLLPLIANRGTSALLVAIVIVTGAVLGRGVLRNRPERRVLTLGLALAAACGVLDAAANAFLLWGVRLGELSVMGVLVALYPAGTILLARLVLRERIAPVQYVGLALAIVASALLALS